MYNINGLSKYSSPYNLNNNINLNLPDGNNQSEYLFWDVNTSQWVVGSNSVHLGTNSNLINAGQYCVALGSNAGRINQGDNSIMLGHRSGFSHSSANSILINASGNEINPDNSGFFVNPITNYTSQINDKVLFYDTATNEIKYSTLANILANYLPLSGGILTGSLYFQSANPNSNQIIFGTTNLFTIQNVNNFSDHSQDYLRIGKNGYDNFMILNDGSVIINTSLNGISATQLSYLTTISSNIQTQLNNINSNFSNYLPLVGGTLSGNLNTNSQINFSSGKINIGNTSVVSTQQNVNSIILNGSSSVLNNNKSGLFIDPIASGTGSNEFLFYNTGTKEVYHSLYTPPQPINSQYYLENTVSNTSPALKNMNPNLNTSLTEDIITIPLYTSSGIVQDFSTGNFGSLNINFVPSGQYSYNFWIRTLLGTPLVITLKLYILNTDYTNILLGQTSFTLSSGSTSINNYIGNFYCIESTCSVQSVIWLDITYSGGITSLDTLYFYNQGITHPAYFQTSFGGFQNIISAPTGNLFIGAGINVIPSYQAYSVNSLANNFVLRDSSANLFANNVNGYEGHASIGTISLTKSSSIYQYFTSGAGSCNLVLPDATTLQNGFMFYVNNNGSGNIYVQTYGSSALFTMPSNTFVLIVCLSNSFSAGQWDYHYSLPSSSPYKINPTSGTGTNQLMFYDTSSSLVQYNPVSVLSSTYLPLVGGTLTGNLNSITPTQLSYLTTISSNVQSQLNTINSNLSNYLPLVGGTLSGNLNGITPTQLTYLTSISSNVQSQFNTINSNLSTYLPLVGGTLTGNLNGITPTQLSYLTTISSNVQSQLNNVQTQLNSKLNLIGGQMTGGLQNTQPIYLNNSTLSDINQIQFDNGTRTYTIQQRDTAGSDYLRLGRNGYDDITIDGSGNFTVSHNLYLNSLTASTVPYLNSSKQLVSSSVSNTTLSYLDATSSIQSQFNTINSNLSTYLPLVGGTLTGNLNGITPTQLSYLTTISSNVQSQLNNVQTQLNSKLNLIGGQMTGGLQNTQPIYLNNSTLSDINQIQFDNGTRTYTIQQRDTAGSDYLRLGRNGYDDITIDGSGNFTVSHNLYLNSLTASTVPYLNSSKQLVSSSVSNTTLSYLDATSSIQSQFNTINSNFSNYLPLSGGTLTGNLNGITPTKLSYLTTLSSNVQTQLDNLNSRLTLPSGTNYSDYLFWNGSAWNVGGSTLHLGTNAEQVATGTSTIGLGYFAGNSTQNNYAIAVGAQSGQNNQGTQSVAVGLNAGNSNQGTNCVAIGAYAGYSSQASNSIVLNASGSVLNSTNSGFFVNPLSNNTGSNQVLFYNTGTKEISYFANPFLTTTLASTTYLPLSGGVMTGAIYLNNTSGANVNQIQFYNGTQIFTIQQLDTGYNYLRIGRNGYSDLIVDASGNFTVSHSLYLNALTASTVPYLNSSKQLVSSSVSNTTLGYLDATSSIQGQFNNIVNGTSIFNYLICNSSAGTKNNFQGVIIDWNASAGQGETSFKNFHGGGPGYWNFLNYSFASPCVLENTISLVPTQSSDIIALQSWVIGNFLPTGTISQDINQSAPYNINCGYQISTGVGDTSGSVKLGGPLVMNSSSYGSQYQWKSYATLGVSQLNLYRNTTSGTPTWTEIAYIDSSGYWLQVSDERRKENIKKLDESKSLEKINKIDLYSYQYKHRYNDDETCIGVIAQEVEKITPAVRHKKNEDETETLSVNYNDLLIHALGAIKELTKKYNNLEKLVVEQTEEIYELKSLIFKIKKIKNS